MPSKDTSGEPTRLITPKFVLTVSIVLVAAVLAVAEIRQNPVLIEPFKVPEELAKRGMDGDVLANELLDHMNEVSTEATTIWQRRQFAGSWSSIDITVPAAGFSFQTIVRFVRHALHIPETRIGGELVETTDGLWHLNVRLVQSKLVLSRPVLLDELDRHLADAAEALYYETDPFTLAAYYWARDPSKAQEVIVHCLSTPPTDDDAWAFNLWGNLQLQASQPATAITKFREASQIAPTWWVPHHNWGIALMAQHKTDEALGHFRAALALGGGRSVKLLTDLGAALNARHDYRGAYEILDGAVRLDRSYSAAVMQLARTESALGRPEQARQLCARLDGMFGHEGAVQETCGDVAAGLGDDRAAASYYARAAENLALTSSFCLKWAKVLEHMGARDEARRQYQNAADLDQQNGDARAAIERLNKAAAPHGGTQMR